MLEPTTTRINRRTRGKTWDISPATEKDGFVRIWVNFRGKIHHNKWVRVADLDDDRTQSIKLFQIVTLVVPEKKEEPHRKESVQHAGVTA